MPANSAVTDYISQLQYDPRLLLSVPASGSTESLPAKDRSASSSGVIICKNQKQSLQKDFTDIVIMRPTSGAVFPGALVRANRRLAEGNPDAITLARADVTISLDLPGMGDEGRRTVKPRFSDIQVAVNAVLEYWNAKTSQTGYINAARSFQTVTKAYSSEQLALDLGFSSKWTSGEVSAKLNTSGSRESSVAVGFFKQVYYTVTMDFPEYPGSLFGEEITVDLLRAAGIDKDNPPGYVSSVDYGRLVMVKMETSSSHLKADMEGALQQATAGGTTVDASVKAKYEKIVNNSTFTVIALGGNPNDAARITEPKDLDQLPVLIKSGAAYSREHPGAPISYTVRFLKDNQLAAMGFTTDFNQQECVEYPNGYVKLEHAGAYVAKFTVNWDEQNQAGNYAAATPYESGNKTAGFTKLVPLPGDAKNIKVFAEAATGLVWDPWGEIFNVTLSSVNNKTYKATGTTLNRSYEVIDPPT